MKQLFQLQYGTHIKFVFAISIIATINFKVFLISIFSPKHFSEFVLHICITARFFYHILYFILGSPTT